VQPGHRRFRRARKRHAHGAPAGPGDTIRAAAGNRIVLLAGEAGTGRTRLLQAFAEQRGDATPWQGGQALVIRAAVRSLAAAGLFSTA